MTDRRTVTVQRWRERWGYVICDGLGVIYVSPYRWHSEQAAREAGERDAE